MVCSRPSPDDVNLNTIQLRNHQHPYPAHLPTLLDLITIPDQAAVTHNHIHILIKSIQINPLHPLLNSTIQVYTPLLHHNLTTTPDPPCHTTTAATTMVDGEEEEEAKEIECPFIQDLSYQEIHT